MTAVQPNPLPAGALLTAYRDAGDYTDCFITSVAGDVELPALISAFYSTWLFAMERFILKWVVKKPSTAQDILRLSTGEAEQFAAWSVETRHEDQLLLTDFRGHTRSWLMCRAAQEPGRTELLFGSAVVSPEHRRQLGQRRPDGYSVLMPVHRMYSVALLACARRKLAKTAQSSTER